MIRRLVRLLTALVVLSVLVGCDGGFGTPRSSPTPMPVTSTREPTPVAVRFGEVVWVSRIDADTGAPVDPLTTLPSSAPRIYAAVQAEVLPAGVPLQARWTIDGSALSEIEPDPVVVDTDREETWISWSLRWTADEPWPIGVLGIVIEVGGESAVTSEIPIVRGREDT